MIGQQEIRFRVSLDDSGVPAVARRTTEAFTTLDRGARGGSAALKAFGDQSGLTRQQLQALSYQTTDIVTQLAGGQSPLLVLLQQGGQLRDQFGGAGNVLKAFGQVLTPLRVAAGGVAAGIGLMVTAVVQGSAEVDKFNKLVALNGRAAGVTRGEVDAMAESLVKVGNTSIPQAREALTELAGTGVFMGRNMELAGRATVALAKLTGESEAEVAKSLAGMGDGVADWAAKANKAYNFLTVEVYRHIKALEDQGRTNEAIGLTLRELADTMQNRVQPAAGYLQQAIDGVTKTAKNMWAALLGFGAPESTEATFRRLSKELQDFEAGMPNLKVDASRRADIEARRQQLQAQVAGAREAMVVERRSTEQSAAQAATARAGIAAARKADSQSALNDARRLAEARLGLEAAEQSKSMALLESGGADKLRTLQRQYQQFEITAAQYEQGVQQIERDRAQREVDAAQAEVARQRRRPAQDAASEVQRRTAVLQAEIKLQRAIGDRAKLEAEIADGKFNATPRNVAESPAAAFRQAEIAATADVERQWLERLGVARSGAQSLVAENRSLADSLITDDRARGQRQIDIEEQQLRQRLDLAVLNADERRQVEDELARWRVLRQQQLTDQLKPQWQRDAELWADTTRYMAQRYDEFLAGFVDRGREAFAEWVASGRVSVSGLTQFIRAEFAKLAYERFLASYVRSAADWLFSTLLGGPSAPSSGAPDDVPTRGGRALGGNVSPNSAWVVGERGPEVLVMGRQGGHVVPHAPATAAGQPMVQVVQHFSLKGDENNATLVRFAAMARDAAMAGVANARARGNPAFAGA